MLWFLVAGISRECLVSGRHAHRLNELFRA